MNSAAVLIPVLNRPHRVKALIDSLKASEHPGLPCRPVFVCSPDDKDEIAAVKAAGIAPMIVEWQPGRGDYAKKINYAFAATDEEWVLLGADDIQFHAGWLQEAMLIHRLYHPCVIGTNDLGNPRVQSGAHSVYTLVHRAYAECGTIDDDTVLLHEGYWHNFVDDEFIGTARHRETYMHAVRSHVEHLHPHWKKAPQDETYKLGQTHFEEDRRYYTQRKRLWGGDLVRTTRRGVR